MQRVSITLMSIVYTVNQMNFFWNYIEDEGKIYLIVIKYYVGTDMFGFEIPKKLRRLPINAVLSNPDESYAWSPCLFQSQVTSRKPGKLRKNVGQWISCLIFVSILTINIMNIHVKSKSLNKIWVNSYSHNIHMQLALEKSKRISFTISK